MAALVLMGACCYAQKANVKKAKNLVLQEEPDFNTARSLITPALTNDETKGLAETWYVAGLVGYMQNEKDYLDQQVGRTIDNELNGQSIMESFNCWVKADEIAMTPVYDKKGKAKVDEKTRKNIASKMIDYYLKRSFISYGSYLNDKKDYKGAYEALCCHLQIPELPMMQDEKRQAQLLRDTIYEQFKYYAATFASQAGMHAEAIALLEGMKDNEYEAAAINSYLYQEYVAIKDTAKFVAQLQACVERFPKEPWFLQNMINYYINTDQIEQAVEYLTQAIDREPEVAEYYLIRGNIVASKGRYEEAIKDYDEALKIDPTLADAVAGYGRVYYDEALQINEDAANIVDAKEYNKALEEMNAMFKKSLPYFEKAHKMDPTNKNYMQPLRALYYRFEMKAEYEKISAEMNQ